MPSRNFFNVAVFSPTRRLGLVDLPTLLFLTQTLSLGFGSIIHRRQRYPRLSQVPAWSIETAVQLSFHDPLIVGLEEYERGPMDGNGELASFQGTDVDTTWKPVDAAGNLV
ncbi:hypothetical protein NEUTE2DRAFT_55076 [Neurospora tetrasperma FGSC 2509]|nr:hypothetical protein NEUTE2DRAFT_55076 [Neurospora tetrasperma FGSC 2509]